jgi:hypothetical protein
MARRESHWPVPAGRSAGRLVAAVAGGAILLAGAVAALSVAPAAASPGSASASGGRAVTQAAAVPGNDAPAGFWYGTDSAEVTVKGTAPPYWEPVIGGHYGGYIGMTANWANLEDCHKIVVWSATNSAQANANYAQHLGVGTGVYYFMGGPGVDPHYNGTTGEASAWGAAQAAYALADTANLHVTYPVLWMDIELPGGPSDYTPAPDNGWNSVYTAPCSSVVKSDGQRGPGRPGRVRGLRDQSLLVQGRRVLGARHLGLDLRHRLRRVHTEHLRMDLRGVYQQPGPPAGGLVPDRQRVVDLRELLRRADQRQQIRADVAVVGRRRKP